MGRRLVRRIGQATMGEDLSLGTLYMYMVADSQATTRLLFNEYSLWSTLHYAAERRPKGTARQRRLTRQRRMQAARRKP